MKQINFAFWTWKQQIDSILGQIVFTHENSFIFEEEVFNRLGKCMCSVHFQVAEQALNLTANETISYYITRQRQRIVPILYPYLQKAKSFSPLIIFFPKNFFLNWESPFSLAWHSSIGYCKYSCNSSRNGWNAL